MSFLHMTHPEALAGTVEAIADMARGLRYSNERARVRAIDYCASRGIYFSELLTEVGTREAHEVFRLFVTEYQEEYRHGRHEVRQEPRA
jgi:hypothetical protein